MIGVRCQFIWWGILQGIPSLVAATCVLLGATALYLRRARHADVVDLIAFLVGFTGAAASLGAMWTYAFTAPVLAREAPDLLTSTGSGIVRAVVVSMFLGQVGWLVIAVAAWRANAIPRWASIVAVGSSVLAIGIAPLAQTQFLRLSYSVVLGIGPLVVGYALYAGSQRRHDPAHQSAPSRGPDA